MPVPTVRCLPDAWPLRLFAALLLDVARIISGARVCADQKTPGAVREEIDWLDGGGLIAFEDCCRWLNLDPRKTKTAILSRRRHRRHRTEAA
jgi:hypothetical protein